MSNTKELMIDENPGSPLQFKWRKHNVTEALLDEVFEMSDKDLLEGCDVDALTSENRVIVAKAKAEADRRNATETKESPVNNLEHDAGCICRGNLRTIVAETESMIDKKFIDTHSGKEYIFYGVVIGSDDYYYGMWPVGDYKPTLLSCVGSFAGHGFTLVEDQGS